MDIEAIKALELIPSIKKCIDNNTLLVYGMAGTKVDIHQHQIDKICEIKKQYNLTVNAILSQFVKIDDDDIFMECYIFIDEESQPWIINETHSHIGVMAYVVNQEWGIEEIGSIGVMEKNNTLFRVH